MILQDTDSDSVFPWIYFAWFSPENSSTNIMRKEGMISEKTWQNTCYTIALVGILHILGVCPQKAGGCSDTGDNCLQWAVQGKCTSDFDFMLENCKATCNLCNIPSKNNYKDDEADLDSPTSLPLLFSGQYANQQDKGRSSLDVRGIGVYPIADSDQEENQHGDAAGTEDEAAWVGGDARIRLYQPVLADVCCWGHLVDVRYVRMYIHILCACHRFTYSIRACA
jgi:hypothetical protein